MLSALIPPVGRKPAVPLAGQLAHESYVRPGPLVLGTAFLRSPAAASDRDRHCCYRRAPFGAGGQVISAWLCMSPCRSDHLFTAPARQPRTALGIWSLRILDRVPGERCHAFTIDETRPVRIQPFLLIGRTCRIVTVPTVRGPRAYVSGVPATTSWGRVAQDTPAFPAFSQV
jgi:hypothetical protein